MLLTHFILPEIFLLLVPLLERGASSKQLSLISPHKIRLPSLCNACAFVVSVLIDFKFLEGSDLIFVTLPTHILPGANSVLCSKQVLTNIEYR